MKILLFGASGRLGGAFRRGLTDHTLITPSQQDVDLTNESLLLSFLESHPSDLMINATAYNKCDAAESEDGWKEAEEMNVRVPERLARFASAKHIPFIHFSTDYVFDGTKKEGYSEHDEPHPINAYGRSKHEGELAVMRAYPDATVIRVSKLFGSSADSPQAKKDFVEIVKMKSIGTEVIDFLDSEFSSPTLVDDVVEHIQKYLMPKPPAGIFHLTNSGGCTWFTWAEKIVKQLNLPVRVEKRLTISERSAVIPQHTMLLSTKIPPMRSWQEALRSYLTPNP